jgi:hypothetical protein
MLYYYLLFYSSDITRKNSDLRHGWRPLVTGIQPPKSMLKLKLLISVRFVHSHTVRKARWKALSKTVLNISITLTNICALKIKIFFRNKVECGMASWCFCLSGCLHSPRERRYPKQIVRDNCRVASIERLHTRTGTRHVINPP